MADTLENVVLPKGGEWVDLYAATGISPESVIEVDSLNSQGVDVSISASSPASDAGYVIINKGEKKTFSPGGSKVWARSVPGTSVNVSVPKSAQTANNSGEIVPAQAIQFLDNLMMVGHFGQAVTCELDSQVSINWAYRRIDTQFDNDPAVLSGDGVANADGGLGTVSSASSGEAKLDSRNQLRYSNGRGFFAFFTAMFDGTGEGWAGPHDDRDGFPVYRNGTTDVLEFSYLKEGVNTSPVDIPFANLGIDPAKENIYAVLGGFLGVANPTLLVRKDKWIPVAIIKTEGVLTGKHVDIPAFPLRIHAKNGMTVKSGSWHAGTMGNAERAQDRGFSIPKDPFTDGAGVNPITEPQGKVAIPANSVRTAIVIRAKDLYNGLPNKIVTDVIDWKVDVVAGANSSGVIQVQLIGNPTIAGNVWQDVSPSSVIEFDSYDFTTNGGGSAGQYDPATSGGVPVGILLNVPYSSAAGNQATPNFSGSIQVDQFDLDGKAGETLALVIRNIGADPVDIYYTLTNIERQI